MHLTKLLVILVVILSGCQGMPTPPTGQMYLHFNDFALCSDLETGQTCPKIPMSATQNYPMFAPATWKNISNYIDELIRAVKSQKSSSSLFLSSEKSDETLNALYRIKFAMQSANKNWRTRK